MVRDSSFHTVQLNRKPSLRETSGPTPQCLFRVKLRRTQCEHMLSALPPEADIEPTLRHFGFVPNPEVALPSRRHCFALKPVALLIEAEGAGGELKNLRR